MKKQSFVSQVDYLREAMNLLVHMGAKEPYEELKKSIQKKYGVSLEVVEKKFALLIQIEGAMKEQLKDKQKELEYYFGIDKEDGHNVGEIAILWEDTTSNKYPTLELLKRALNAMDENTFNKDFGKRLIGYKTTMEVKLEQNELKEPIEIIRYITDMDIEDEMKWKLQQIYLKPKYHQEKVLELLELSLEVLKRFQTQLDALGEAFASYWQEKLKNTTILNFVSETIGLKLDESPYGTKMYPSIVRLNSLAFFADLDDDGEIKEPYNFFMGILFDDDFELRLNPEDSVNEKERVIRILKMLSDSSKFEILSYIRDKKAYGSELARQLNLTTATVSHHMTVLLKAGLVQMEKEDTKIYYSANTAAINEVLDYCRKILVD